MKLALNKNAGLIFMLLLSTLIYEPFIFRSLINNTLLVISLLFFTVFFLKNLRYKNIDTSIRFSIVFVIIAFIIFFFAEPSYLGFFLGLNLVFFSECRKIPIYQLCLMFLAALLSFSKTTILCLIIVSLCFIFFTLLRIKSNAVRFFLVLIFFISF